MIHTCLYGLVIWTSVYHAVGCFNSMIYTCLHGLVIWTRTVTVYNISHFSFQMLGMHSMKTKRLVTFTHDALRRLTLEVENLRMLAFCRDALHTQTLAFPLDAHRVLAFLAVVHRMTVPTHDVLLVPHHISTSQHLTNCLKREAFQN